MNHYYESPLSSRYASDYMLRLFSPETRTLTWRKVYKTPDGKTLYIHVFMQKTQKPNNIPLSQEALNCIQAKDNLDEPIFTLPASDATINYHVKKLVKAAGIEKNSQQASSHTLPLSSATARTVFSSTR